MKTIFFVCLLSVSLILLSFSILAIGSEEQISENITKFIEGLDRISEMEPEEIRGYLLLLADSIILIAPQVDIPQDIQSEMKESVAAYRNVENVILQEGSVDSLWKAARFINPDFDLNFPDNATSETIKEDVRLELHLALSFLDQGKMNRVEEILIRTLLSIITPHRI
ncbi:MAG: hypothetical protein MUP98_08845 [Candidatus Aminicenantes bacterium]|nr:hypothetical protein [Candidatus Aminicenantes bacterium]